MAVKKKNRKKLYPHIEPLVVRPREAWAMLGCGKDHGYKLLNSGQLDSYEDGWARKITVESIERYVARRLAEPRTKLRPNARNKAAAAKKRLRSNPRKAAIPQIEETQP